MDAVVIGLILFAVIFLVLNSMTAVGIANSFSDVGAKNREPPSSDTPQSPATSDTKTPSGDGSQQLDGKMFFIDDKGWLAVLKFVPNSKVKIYLGTTELMENTYEIIDGIVTIGPEREKILKLSDYSAPNAPGAKVTLHVPDNALDGKQYKQVGTCEDNYGESVRISFTKDMMNMAGASIKYTSSKIYYEGKLSRIVFDESEIRFLSIEFSEDLRTLTTRMPSKCTWQEVNSATTSGYALPRLVMFQ